MGNWLSRQLQSSIPQRELLHMEQGRAGKPAVPQLALLTLSSGSSEKELAPRSSPS